MRVKVQADTLLGTIRFQTVEIVNSSPFVYSSLQRAFWQGFSNTGVTYVPRGRAAFNALCLAQSSRSVAKSHAMRATMRPTARPGGCKRLPRARRC